MIRNNEQSVKYRYLQLRNEPEKVQKLKYLYPDQVPVFSAYEAYIDRIANNILTSYTARYVNGAYVVVPQEEYSVMVGCHKWFQRGETMDVVEPDGTTKKKRRPVDLVIVKEVISKQTPTNVNKMIRALQKEDNDAKKARVSNE